MMEKKFGKLTEGQFRRLVKQFPEWRKASDEVREAFRKGFKEKEQIGVGVNQILTRRNCGESFGR